MRAHKSHGCQLLLAAPVLLVCGVAPAWANPSGAQVVSGTVSFEQPAAGTLNVINSPGAIIKWQDFSIAPGEVTQFIQQSAASAVLNRVVGGDISQIYGSLISNGQVYLINPSGILIGKGAVIDTAGFVASTLNIRNDDFRAGRLSFQGKKNAGDVINEGLITTTPGGMVLLLAPDIENSGIIEAPGGEILLAAGRKITITSLDIEGVQFQIQSPANSVTNLGQLVADGGAVGVFAGTLNNSGVIQANTLALDETGHIVLAASNQLEVAAGGSVTADGAQGGAITLQSGKQLRVEGEVSATGSAGSGGEVQLLGKQVSLAGAAEVDVSGASGGGTLLVGGDYQGANPEVTNASTTYVGPDVVLKADALDSGDGGSIIVWSDQLTRFFGSLSARGGANGGDGGFAEISGKQQLLMDGAVDLAAPQGQLGTLLLDPLDLFVDDRGGGLAGLADELSDVPANVVTVSPDTLAAVTGNVQLQATRDLYFLSDVDLTTAGQALSAQAGDDMLINASISTNNGALALTAGDGFSTISGGPYTLATGGGALTLSAGSGLLNLPQVSLDAASGAVSVSAPLGVFTSNVTGGVVSLSSSAGTVDTDDLSSSGNLSLSGTSVQTLAISTNGGTLTATASNGHFIANGDIDTRPGQAGATGGAVTIAADDSDGSFGQGYVDTRAINAGNAAVSLSGESIDTSGQAIATSGNVTLTAVHNDSFANATITAKVNDAASVVATANHQETGNGLSAVINLSSDNTLNATTVTASTSGCYFFGSCGGANITLSGVQGVNVGTVTATAPVNFNNTWNFGAAYADPRYENINETVNISSSAGSIQAISGSSLISAADVSLSTIPGSLAATGGDIGSLATPLKVDAERNFTLKAGGDFNVQLQNDGPNRLDIQLGVAPTGETWNGTLSGSGHNGVALSASATDSTVTVSNFTLSGFDQRVYNQAPSIGLYAPNGDLDVLAMSVPRGDNTGSYAPSTRFTSAQFFPADVCVNGTASCTYRNSPSGLTTTTVNASYESLAVSVRASGDLAVDSYVRDGAGGDQAKSSTFQSDNGSVTLASIDGNRDSISVVADTGISLTDDLTTGGNVTLSNLISGDISVGDGAGDLLGSGGSVTISNSGSGTGDVNIVAIDTTAGSGGVSITANGTLATIGAAIDSSALEIDAAGAISLTAVNLGSSGYANPLDLAGSAVTLARPAANVNAGQFGAAGAPIMADTQTLTVNAVSAVVDFTGSTPVGGSTFNVSTGATALTTLSVTADPVFVGAGGLAQVRTEAGGAGDMTYSFSSDGLGFDFDPGAIPATQFAGGSLSFTSTQGDITLGDLNLGTGALTVTAREGSILGNAALDGASITLAAGVDNNVSTGSVEVEVGAIGASVAPGSLQITSGNAGTFTSRAGTLFTFAIEADTINLASHGGDLGVADIGAASAAGSVTLAVNNTSFFGGDAGSLSVGNVEADSITLSSGANAVSNSLTAGNLDAASSIAITADSSIATGTLDAPTVSLGPTYCCFPTVTTGAIGGTTTVESLDVDGATVTLGTITGDAAGSTIDVYASGLLTVGGAITGGDGSSITLESNGGTAFQLTKIDAGSSGTVSITSPSGISQTSSDAAGNGITAGSVTLDASSGSISQTTAGDGSLDLYQVSQLTLEVGDLLSLDGHGSILDVLSLTTHGSGPDGSPLSLINLGGGQDVTTADLGNGGYNLEVTTPGALDFTFNATAAGVSTTGGGIDTNGGGLVLSSGFGLDLDTGGLASGGGAISLSSDTSIVTGAIDSGGGTLSLQAGTGIQVSAAVTAGSGAISMSTGSGNIDGSGSITAAAGVTLSADSGNIGDQSDVLEIDTPAATLLAYGTDNAGAIYASLAGTSSLTLLSEEYFEVASDTAFSQLSLTTGMGSGIGGAPVLTAPGQSFNWTRVFGDGELVVTGISGTAGSTLTLNTMDGDLRVTGPIAASTLTLGAGYDYSGLVTDTSSTLTLDGSGGALALSNASQTFKAGGDILVQDAVTASATTQTLIAGANITLQSGDAANQSITFSATGSQLFNAGTGAGSGNIVMQAGLGDNADILVQHSGSGNQTLRADGNIALTAGGLSTAAATLLIDNQAGIQDLDAQGAIVLKGGVGDGSTASIVNSGSGNQLIGNTSGWFFDGRQFTTDSITVEGGLGSGAAASVQSTATGGSLQVFETSGLLKFQGGAGANATATASTPGNQQLGWSFFFNVGNTLGSLSLLGGTGSGAYAAVTTPQSQQVWTSGTVTLQGGAQDAYAAITANSQSFSTGDIQLAGGSGSNAYAQLQAVTSQSFSSGDLDLLGGSGTDAYARVQAGTTQSFSLGDLTLAGGSGSGTYARVLALGGSQFFSMDDLQATGGSAAGSDATIQAATSQTFFADDLTLTGGSASGAVARIEAATSQSFDSDDIKLGGGTHASAEALIKGSGQSFDAGDIMLESQDASARIQDLSAGVQQFDAASVSVKSLGAGLAEITTGGSQVFDVAGGFVIETQGSGAAQVVSPSAQSVDAAYLKVLSNASGNAALSATGDQTLLTRNGLASADDLSMQVAALGSGAASVTSGGDQTIELDYPNLMYDASRDGTLQIGDAAAQGVSTLSAVGDQTIIAREIAIEGGSANGASAKLNADGAQVISTLLAGISIAGGSGNGASASLDPTSQIIVTNGNLFISGGSGSGAFGSVLSTGSQFIAATGGDFVLTGGSGADASASITTSFSAMTLMTPGSIDLTPGSGADADAFLSSGRGFGFVNLFCGAGCSLSSLFSDPVGNGRADAGIFTFPLASSTFDVTEIIGDGYPGDWYLADRGTQQDTTPGRTRICQ